MGNSRRLEAKGRKEWKLCLMMMEDLACYHYINSSSWLWHKEPSTVSLSHTARMRVLRYFCFLFSHVWHCFKWPCFVKFSINKEGSPFWEMIVITSKFMVYDIGHFNFSVKFSGLPFWQVKYLSSISTVGNVEYCSIESFLTNTFISSATVIFPQMPPHLPVS